MPGCFPPVPGPKIRQRLQGCEVAEGEEARFSLELSASLPGTWFLNSTQLQQGGRYAVQQAQGQHSLVIGETRMADNAAEVTFIANGIRDLAVLKVQSMSYFVSYFYFLRDLHYKSTEENGISSTLAPHYFLIFKLFHVPKMPIDDIVCVCSRINCVKVSKLLG